MTRSMNRHGADPTGEDDFDPVVLNLGSHTDYFVITDSLEEFISRAEGEISDEIQEGLDPESKWSKRELLQDYAERAKRMLADIERQLEANGQALPGSDDL
ncbi:hypothetical protein [Brachybacterium kimchii]|uniref:Uncharacterized protein n=1 Tax=Brachybacterium kimchii TaxID=2942909 RepID=A0ABY4N9N6_9MICO|nr:hypothetical protein [Brachybacterium kimchii]UQN30521.1 hypothetical protein M4486_04210 [Brachybacterium kimchii]